LLIGFTRPTNEGSAARGAGSFAEEFSSPSPNERREAAAAADAADTRKNERREIMLAPVTNSIPRDSVNRVAEQSLKKRSRRLTDRPGIVGADPRRARCIRAFEGLRNPHKRRDFHQNIPLVAQRIRENISSTEEQSSREESRKRPSRALATVLTSRRETGG
jgi:hypothetical protein